MDQINIYDMLNPPMEQLTMLELMEQATAADTADTANTNADTNASNKEDIIMDKEITTFGTRKLSYYYDFEVIHDIEILKELCALITQPQILTCDGYQPIELHTREYDNHFFGADSILWLYDCAKADGYNGDIRSYLLQHSDEDIEWTTMRNEGCTYIAYRKITFVPELQAALIAKYQEYIGILEAILDTMRKEESEKEAARAERHAKWELSKLYKQIKPRGGECGTDGYVDADYRTPDGITIRMVERNVFDVGHYSYPKRLEGTGDALNDAKWTELEKDAAAWIAEFGQIPGLRM